MRWETLLSAFLLVPLVALAETKSGIVISEVRVEGETANDEFIRLENTDTVDIPLDGSRIVEKVFSKKSGSCSEETLVASSRFDGKTIAAGQGFLIAHPDYKGTETVDIFYPKSNTLTDSTMEVILYGNGGVLVNRNIIGSSCDESTTPEEPVPTPEPTPDPGQLTEKQPTTIRINELFPNPKEKGEADEWIELANFGAASISLKGWTVRDASKTGKYIFEENISIDPGAFFVLRKATSRLSLNNSNETVSLINPAGATTDSVSYGSSIEETSFGRSPDGAFRWTKTPTPGTENVFGKEPKTKKKSIPEEAYQDVPATFLASGNKKDMKYVWDFGDGHKSYKSETSHTYRKTGTFDGTLTVSDGTEKAVTTFSIEVKKYPDYHIRITALLPNPEGKDEGNEWILLENREKKKSVDLLGWSIASGTKKKTVANHPVRESFILKPGERREMTRASSLFSLPNKRGIIELRKPDHESIQTIKYLRDDGIDEGEVYRKEKKGEPWKWVHEKPEKETSTPPNTTKEEGTDAGTGVESPLAKEESPAAGTTEESGDGELPTESQSGQEFSFSEFISLGTDVSLELPDTAPRVLGISDERERRQLNRDFEITESREVFYRVNEWILKNF